MGLGIDWSVLLSPIIVKIVEALVEAVLKWLEGQEPKKAIETLAVLCDMMSLVEMTADDSKITAVKDLAVWVRSVVA